MKFKLKGRIFCFLKKSIEPVVVSRGTGSISANVPRGLISVRLKLQPRGPASPCHKPWLDCSYSNRRDGLAAIDVIGQETFIIVSDDERPEEKEKPEQEAGHHLQLFLIVTELLIFILATEMDGSRR